MPLFSYLYYLASILIFSVSLGVCFLAYGRLGQEDLLYAGLMMFTRICDMVYVIIGELFSLKDSAHPLVLTVALTLTLVKIYLLGKIIYTIFKKPVPSEFYILLCMIVIIHGLLSTYPRELYWNLDPITFNSSILIICGAYWSFWVQETDAVRRQAARYKHIIQMMLVFSLFAILYIVTGLFLLKTVLSRDFTDLYTNCFYMVISVWYIHFCWRALREETAVETEPLECMEEIRVQAQFGPAFPDQLTAFCRQYELTEREREILQLLLSGKSNQEISEMLYITVGTVKAHVHSVFGKLDVSRRSQLMTKFLDFGVRQTGAAVRLTESI